MEKWIGSFSDQVNKIAGIIGGTFILMMGLIVTYEVIMRSVFDAPTNWVNEISVYMNIACVFLAGGFTLREKMHIQVDTFVVFLSKRNQIRLQTDRHHQQGKYEWACRHNRNGTSSADGKQSVRVQWASSPLRSWFRIK